MTDEKIKKGIQRLALSEDGHALHLFLQQFLMTVCPRPESGALQVHEGERRFAARLKGLMDEAYANAEQDSDRRTGNSLIVVQRAGVNYDASARGAGRRVQPYPTDPQQ